MIGRLLTRASRPAGLEQRSGIPQSERDWRLLFGNPWFGGESAAGVHVTPETALAHSTVFACVWLLSRVVASLPIDLVESVGSGRRIATDHPVYRVLRRPNPSPLWPRAKVFAFLAASYYLRGNALAWIQRDAGGRVLALWPLRWDRVRLDVVRGRVEFVWTPTDARVPEQRFDDSEVWHWCGFSTDGVVGRSPIQVAREAVGEGLAQGHYSASIYSRGLLPAGLLKVKKSLGPDPATARANAARVRATFEDATVGSGRWHGVGILEEDTEWQAMALSHADAEFLASRKFNRGEVCGFFGVPPHLIGDLERAIQANIETQSLEFVAYQLVPHLVGIESAGDRVLLDESEQGRLAVKFNAAGLLRGDHKARSEFYKAGIQWSFLTPNEVRAYEELNPIEGGDRLLLPANMAVLEADGTITPIAAGDSGIDGDPLGMDPTAAGMRAAALRLARSTAPRGRLEARARRGSDLRAAAAERWKPPLAALVVQLVRAERREVLELVDKHFPAPPEPEQRAAVPAPATVPAAFAADLEALYTGDLAGLFTKRAGPIVAAIAETAFELAAAETENEPDRAGLETWAAGLVAGFVARYAQNSRRSLEALVAADTTNAAPNARLLFERWEVERPDGVANRESVALSRGAAREAWKRAGVTGLRWVTRGADTCEFCAKLDGAIVSIESSFAAEGEVVPGDGTNPPIRARHERRHPPLHRGCVCEIEPFNLT